jgi:hypothetical protein
LISPRLWSLSLSWKIDDVQCHHIINLLLQAKPYPLKPLQKK